ncbi:MAG: protein kinase, partial [Planctomycetes bacterium]|nr:protein kinase [Planctomycetota bacterium]
MDGRTLIASQEELEPIADPAEHEFDLTRSFRDENLPLCEGPERGRSGEHEGSGETAISFDDESRRQRYRILEKIGEGGFAEVYLARDEQLDRLVALKTPMHGTRLSLETLRQFAVEARAAAQLNHPNLVAVHDSGLFGDSGYITYSHCSGPTLKEWIAARETPVPVRMAAEILLQLCDGIMHAHSRGILHCDLKPSNILLEPQVDDAGRPRDASIKGFPFLPKTGDFGLAKFLNAPPPASSRAAIAGTLAYMAPEQAAGDQEAISMATDTYGLGTILYELLTGVPPVAPPPKARLASLLRHIQTVPALPPRQLRPDIPKDLEAICRKCLEIDPEKRYGCVSDLADDLKRFLDRCPVAARPSSFARRLQLGMVRHPVLTVVAVVFFLAPAVMIAGLAWHAQALAHLNQQLRESVVTAERARRSTETSRAELLHQIYATDMNRAYQAWQQGDPYEYEVLLRKYRPKRNDADVRTLPWYFLRRLGQVGSRPIAFPGDSLYSVCVSPAGDRVAVAGKKAIVYVFDARDYSEILAFDTAQKEVNSVQFSEDGQRLLTAGDDGTVRFWEARTGRLLQTISAHPEAKAFWALYSPDGGTLATAGNEPIVRLWNVVDGKLLAELPHPGSVETITFSPDGRSLAVAARARQLTIWDISQRRRPIRREIVAADPASRLLTVAFSRDSRLVAVGTVFGWVRVFDARTGKGCHSWRNLDGVQVVAFSPSGDFLAAGDRGGTIRVWEVGRDVGTPGQLLRSWPAHDGRVYALSFWKDGRRLVSAGADGFARVWQDWETTVERTLDFGALAIEPEKLARLHDIITIPGTSLLLAAHRTDRPRIWSAATGRPVGELPTNRKGWLKVAASPDGRLLAAATDDGVVAVWEAKSARQIDEFHVATDGKLWAGTSALSFSGDSTKLALAIRDNRPEEVHIFDLDSGEKLPFNGCVECDSLAFSARNGPRGLAMAVLNDLWVFDSRTLERTAVWEGHTNTVNEVAYSPDGRWIATASDDRRILLWDLEGSPTPVPLLGHRCEVLELAFTDDSMSLVSGDKNGRVCIWDIRTHRLSLQFRRSEAPVNALAVSSDSHHLAVLYGDTSAHSETQVVVYDTSLVDQP